MLHVSYTGTTSINQNGGILKRPLYVDRQPTILSFSPWQPPSICKLPSDQSPAAISSVFPSEGTPNPRLAAHLQALRPELPWPSPIPIAAPLHEAPSLHPPSVQGQSKRLTLFWPPARRSDSARRRLSTSGPLDNASPGPPAGHLRHPLRGDRRDREGPSPSAPRSLGSLRFRSPTFAILDLPAPNPESKSPRVFWAKHGNPPQTKTALSPLGQNRQPPVLPVKPADRDLPGSPLGRNSALTHQADGSQRRPRATTNADRCPWVAPSDGTKPQGFFSRDSEITGL